MLSCEAICLISRISYQTKKMSVNISAKMWISKIFWELGSQVPILFPPLKIPIIEILLLMVNHKSHEVQFNNLVLYKLFRMTFV